MNFHLLKYLTIAQLTIFVSCSSPRFNYLNPTAINYNLCEIDSTANALFGYEPKENPDLGWPGIDKPEQETFDIARRTWDEFKTKCYEQDYKGAYDLYCEEGRSGDFLVFLKHSSLRFQFDKEVLAPLFYEYEEKNRADSLYIDILELEYMLEALTMQQSVGNTDYIPTELPNVILELGTLLSQNGRIDDAFALIDDYAYAMNGILGSPSKTNYAITILASSFYKNAGQDEDALSTLQQYKEYSREHLSSFENAEEYEYLMKETDKYINSLK